LQDGKQQFHFRFTDLHYLVHESNDSLEAATISQLAVHVHAC
jgi:hypothetical protein